MDITRFRLAAILCLLGELFSASKIAAQDEDRRAFAAIKEATDLNRLEKLEEATALIAKLERQYEEAVKVRSQDPLLWLGLARLQLHSDKDHAAADSLAKAARLQPENGRVRSLRGLALGRQKEYSAANAEFQKALELAPRDVQVRMEYAFCLGVQKRKGEAEAQAHEAVKLDPRNVDVVIVWCMMLCNVEKTADAIGTLTAVAELNPQNHAVRELLAQIFWASRQPLEAYVQRVEIRKQFPDLISNEAQMVVLSSQLRNAKQAEEHIARLRELQRVQAKVTETYSRDEFIVANRQVVVEEFFEPTGELGLKFTLYIVDHKEKSHGQIELGCIDQITEKLRNDGNLKAAEKAWCLWWRNGAESNTYAIFVDEPNYEQVRSAAVEMLEGKLRPFGAQTAREATPTRGLKNR